MTTKLMEKPINPSTNIRIKKPNKINIIKKFLNQD